PGIAGLEVAFDAARPVSPGDHSSPTHPEDPQRLTLPLEVAPQPDDKARCPTCPPAVYRYFGDAIDLTAVAAAESPLPGGGTLAVWLANHALKRGYKATIYTYNLQVFDPSWFTGDANIADRLRAQALATSEEKLGHATEPYLEFLSMGGRLRLGENTS